MARIVVENIRPKIPHRFIFICLQDHLDRFPLASSLESWASGCEIVAVSEVTAGAACTVLLARDLIEGDDPLMIANCDQWVDVNVNQYLRELEIGRLDGLIMTMRADHPKWSYVRLDERRRVREVAEKRVISNDATVGIYTYREGTDFVIAASRTISLNLRVNGEFYVAPTYNELISQGKQIGVYNVGGEYAGMYGLGTPSDLEKFVLHPISLRAAGRSADLKMR